MHDEYRRIESLIRLLGAAKITFTPITSYLFTCICRVDAYEIRSLRGVLRAFDISGPQQVQLDHDIIG